MDTESQMRRNGEHEHSIAYWLTQKVLWNGEPVVVTAPAKGWPVSQETGD